MRRVFGEKFRRSLARPKSTDRYCLPVINEVEGKMIRKVWTAAIVTLAGLISGQASAQQEMMGIDLLAQSGTVFDRPYDAPRRLNVNRLSLASLDALSLTPGRLYRSDAFLRTLNVLNKGRMAGKVPSLPLRMWVGRAARLGHHFDQGLGMQITAMIPLTRQLHLEPELRMASSFTTRENDAMTAGLNFRLGF